ncbi:MULTISPECIES: 3-hydroxyacyl-CoA dehydrogenase NAD-binding domain-containing protein [unclassified Shinella]|uniref:3-hydroxyacyl-CoA dehydrogenase NAD-binding domain-containing protein n=1 Tax=unclassified Shinella TaxID=2643062 RepID=UPI00225D82E6|nr:MULTISPECIES: 3-hydroxyacyl-CoA dehydrogenase NAD-binding domain-containing protein [unclassified Shinella]MCO5140735.1 3-hydroxyacyl-CoA dehydrogenase NAD-binding domain-containing protein [Shinella sp.]MDC7256576.1 enoyl-CoA hydratase/isomerase family protein [Shinella sp. YE25]CAI0339450.1 Enoyl-CoA hydratase [Rhizobiaceae bacterium]CAK7257850.1 3-hydroxyacyl-CoA dehydrogenase [Shinella sp. WSC3-e]
MTVTIARENAIAVVTVDNPPVNALSQALRQALVEAVATLDADAAVKAVVLICAGRTFIAGADVSEFGKPPQPPHLPDVVAAIEGASKPWVAAIHGSALGGGLEVALGCAWRVAVPSASLGLPEVKLGIIPGAGGTVRLPRLIGAAAAVDLVTSGSPVGAKKAEGLGLIDAVVDGDLRAGAIAFANAIAGKARPQPISGRTVAPVEAGFWESAEKVVAGKAKREAAPLRALASVRKASETDFASAMAFERETFLELRGSEQAAALRHVFFAERAAPRPPELAGVTPRAIRSAAVIGGGTMGAGIAAALRDAGLPVVLIERDAAAVERGLANVRGIYEGSVKRGRIPQAVADERVAGVTGGDDYGLLADTDLVIEAVFEDLAVKRAVFERLSAVCRPDAVLATNTSYLDPDAISEGVSHPERFLGLHFFSPAQIMKLLEIVPTEATAPEVLATGFALARLLGKIPVRAGICDGFIGNRILKVTRAQAERLLLSGATPAAVDAAMRAFGLPMGPFEAQDLGGLDIAAFQRKAARERGETPFAPVADRLCALERYGQKTGGGWYDYQPGDRAPKPSETVAAIIAEAAEGRVQRTWDEAGIVDAILLPMVNEATRILEERVALRAADIDLVKIHGYGFPRWRGGPMHHAEARGLSAVVAVLDRLAADGLAEPPGDSLRRAAEAGGFSVLAG